MDVPESNHAVAESPIRMAAAALETILAHAREAYPRECCGALLGPVPASCGGRRVDVALRAINEAAGDGRYRLGPEAVGALDADGKARGLCVVGYYHSHPRGDSRPSPADRELAWPWLIYLIQPVDGTAAPEPEAWMLEEGRRSFVRCPLFLEDVED